MIGYQAPKLSPAILAAITFNYLERFFKKVTPSVIQMIVVPFCSLFCLPLWLLTSYLAPLAGPSELGLEALFSQASQVRLHGSLALSLCRICPLVITGLHHMSNAVDMQLIASSNNYGTPLWPMIALSNIAQGSSVLAMSVLQKHDEKCPAGKHSFHHLLLPWRYRTRHVWRQPQIWLPLRMRYDW